MNRAALLVGLLFFVGCGPSYGIVSTFDEFTGARTISMTANQIIYRGIDAKVVFDISRTITKENEVRWVAMILYGNTNWLFVDAEKPVTFLLDGRTVDAPPTVGAAVRSFGGLISFESFVVPLSEELIEQIIAAKVVKMRIHGQSYFDVTFQPANIERIRAFYNMAKPKPTPSSSTPIGA